MTTQYKYVMSTTSPALPSELWQLGKPRPDKPVSFRRLALLRNAVQQTRKHGPWVWPKHPVIFISDPHADAAAFEASLRAAGCIDGAARLTSFGRSCRIIIGGDCLDKGPSNIQMLRSLKTLIDTGANVSVLAGNHDIRLLLGLQSLRLPRTLEHEHLFLRMGPKVVPLLSEIFEHDLGGNIPANTPDESTCKLRLHPRDDWEHVFAENFRQQLSSEALEREIRGIGKKRERFAAACAQANLSWRAVYATVMRSIELFLEPAGEFAWFFQDMKLFARDGSFLFVHAGLDDEMASQLGRMPLEVINHRFQQAVLAQPFQCYFGPLANSLRTKYRASNLPLTQDGVMQAHQAGIYAVVHGHRNRLNGQRLMLRQGLIHIEADITLDRHSRRKEGLNGLGVGLTLIEPNGRVVGYSNDYPRAKVFQPHALLNRTVSHHAAQQERLPA